MFEIKHGLGVILGNAGESERKSNQKQQLSSFDKKQISETEEVRYIIHCHFFLLILN
jgi:hypothetical protein